MATPSSLWSEEQLLCSICLEVFVEPVSTPCGHNFCKTCITKYWEDKELCECPLCKEKFHKAPKLRVNTAFRDVVETFKKHIIPTEALVKPGEVPCDCCLEKKLKASKTCLSCLVSYCETHLQLHYRVAPWKTHKLTDPVQNLEDKICKKHNRMFELFCRNEQICLCAMCTEHNGHDTAPLEAVYEAKKAKLEAKNKKVQRTIQAKLQMVEKLKTRAKTKRKDRDTPINKRSKVLPRLATSTQRHRDQLIDVSEEMQRVETRPEMIIKELEEEIDELQKRAAELAYLLQIEDYVQLIQSFVSLLSSSPPASDCSSDISVRSPLRVEALRGNGEMGRLRQSGEETDLIMTPIDAIEFKEIFESFKWMEIHKHAVDISFDPATANDLLLFSQDLKRVKTAYICHFPRGQLRFDRYTYVLGNKGFSAGRFYFEVHVGGKSGWDLGVVRESMKKTKTITPKPRNGIWIIRLRSNAKCNSPSRLTFIKKPENVGVFTDYKNGLVEFYDADSATLIHSFTHCEFKGRIYPFFSPGPTESGRNCAPLILPYVIPCGQPCTNTANRKQTIRHEDTATDSTQTSMSARSFFIACCVFFVLSLFV